MTHFINYTQLSLAQRIQYQQAIPQAFPKLICASPTSKKHWPRLEKYYPEFQFFLISQEDELIGFMNTIPFHFSQSLNDLPDHGWDWMLKKGVEDFEQNQSRNYLGGLQVIVRKEYQNKGFSKQILNYAKEILNVSNFKKLLIPIRPTKKHLYPLMPMSTYLELREKDQIYDPWIRTHLKSGAEIIKVCTKSMSIKGDIKFWEQILNQKISASGSLPANGALNPIIIDLENNYGQYQEANIWIKYN